MNDNLYFDICCFEGYYKISPDGRIKSLERKIYHSRYGEQYVRERFIAQNIRDGYLCVNLNKEGLRTSFKLHRLLAMTFIPNPNNLPYVRHLNDNRLDNRLVNLAWGTQKDNIKDALSNGRFESMPKGEDSFLYGKKGNAHPMFGRRNGNAVNGKIVLDTQTGIFYSNVFEACEAKGLNRSSTYRKLIPPAKNNTSLIYA
jgi:hypothetical protein